MIKRFIVLVVAFMFLIPSLCFSAGVVYHGRRTKLTNKYGQTNKWMNPHTLYPGKYSGVYSESLKRDNREKWVKEQYEKQRFNFKIKPQPKVGGGTSYRAPRKRSSSSIMISRGTAIITYEIRDRVYERTGKFIPYKITICQLADILKAHFADLEHYKNLTEYIEGQCIR